MREESTQREGSLFESSGEGKEVYTFIKVKFFSQERGIYGIVLISYMPQHLICDQVLLTLTSYSMDYSSLRGHSSYKDFYNAIYNKNKEGISFKNIYFKLSQILKSSFSISEGGTQLKDMSDIDHGMRDIIKKIISDPKIMLFTFIEEVSVDDYDAFFGRGKGGSSDEEKEEASLSLEDGESEDLALLVHVKIPTSGEIVDARMILAPIDGKPIFHIRKGDYVFVLLVAAGSEMNVEEEAKKHEKNKNSAESVKNLRKGEVTGTVYFEGCHYVGLHLGGNEYALLSETANMKVKYSDEGNRKKIATSSRQKGIQAAKRSRFIIISTMMLAVFLLIALIFVILSI